jgi:hypothetical protein
MESRHSDVQYIKKVFRNAGIGDVYRVDLIARNGGDPAQTNELSAFIYLDWYTYGVSYMWYQCVLAKNPYMPANLYHSKYDNNPFKYDGSYWILLKNNNPRTLEQVAAEKQVALAKNALAEYVDVYGITAHDDHTYYNAYDTSVEEDMINFNEADAALAEADSALAEADSALADTDSNNTSAKRSPPPLCTDDECSIATCVFRTQPSSSTHSPDNEIGDLRREVSELECTNYDLELANYDLEVTNYDFRLANYNLEIKLADMEKRNKNMHVVMSPGCN